MRFNQNEDAGIFEKLLVLTGIVMMGGTLYYAYDYSNKHHKATHPIKNEKVIPQKVRENNALSANLFVNHLKERMR